jgi:hypothetical protein
MGQALLPRVIDGLLQPSHDECLMNVNWKSMHLRVVAIFHKVPNMSRDMFIQKKKSIPMDGFLENEPVFGRVKFTLEGLWKNQFFW